MPCPTISRLPAELAARIRRSVRRKTFAVKLSANGDWHFSVPAAANENEILRAWEHLQPWLAKKQSQLAAMHSENPIFQFRFAPGAEFFFCGEKYELKHISGSRSALIAFRDNNLWTPSADPQQIKTMLEAFYRRQSRRIFTAKVEYLSKRFNIQVGDISINGARRRFGSCSSSGDLNFSWRLAMYPMDLIELVICHELAHRREMNHSRAFYAELAKMLPDHRERNRKLNFWSRKLSAYPA